MKPVRYVGVFLALLSFFSMQAVYAERGVQKALPDHPRLMLLNGEETAAAALAASDVRLNRVHLTILAEAQKFLTKENFERKMTGRRLLNVSRDAVKRIFFLSYAFRMTGEKKYAERAEKDMNDIARFTDWNPSHFLDTAEMTFAMAVGYDWLFNVLSESSKKRIRGAIIDKALNPSLETRYSSSWVSAKTNWNQVCTAGMTAGALAVYEDYPSLAQHIIDRAETSIKIPMAEYDPDGFYPEGYGYWDYGTTYNVFYLNMIERVFGAYAALPESFMKTPYYLLHMTGPTRKPFNYSDSGTAGSIHPAMFWFASRTCDTSLLFTEQSYFDEPKRYASNRFLPALIIWSVGLDMSNIPEPESLSLFGSGQTPAALMRSSWNNDGIYLAVKGGSPSTNHAHMDAGSFIMEADGERWAMDFGMQDYESLESKKVDLWNMKQDSQRWQVFRYHNLSHNTVAINGNLQLVNGKAEITKTSADPQFTFALTDLTPLYKNSCVSLRRSAAIVEKKYALISDEITAGKTAALFRWSMVTDASVTNIGENTAVLEKNGKTLLLKIDSQCSVLVKTWSTTPPNSYDAPNPGTIITGFEAHLRPDTAYKFNVYLIPGSSKLLVPKTKLLI